MSEKIITATLHNLTPIPAGSIYQGGGMFEFVTLAEPETITKKFAEYDPELKLYYKDPAVKVELVSDLMVAEKEKTEEVTKVDLAGKVIEIKPIDPKPIDPIKPAKK